MRAACSRPQVACNMFRRDVHCGMQGVCTVEILSRHFTFYQAACSGRKAPSRPHLFSSSHCALYLAPLLSTPAGPSPGAPQSHQVSIPFWYDNWSDHEVDRAAASALVTTPRHACPAVGGPETGGHAEIRLSRDRRPRQQMQQRLLDPCLPFKRASSTVFGRPGGLGAAATSGAPHYVFSQRQAVRAAGRLAWLRAKFPEIPLEICERLGKTVSGNFPGNLRGRRIPTARTRPSPRISFNSCAPRRPMSILSQHGSTFQPLLAKEPTRWARGSSLGVACPVCARTNGRRPRRPAGGAARGKGGRRHLVAGIPPSW